MERILINLKNKKKNNLLNFTSYYTQSRNFNEKRNNLINEFKEAHSPIKEYVYNKISEAEGLEKAYAHGDYFIHGKQCISPDLILQKIGMTMSLKCLIGAIYDNQPDTKQWETLLKKTHKSVMPWGLALVGVLFCN